MITLYHCVDARLFRALSALEEVGVSYHLEMLPFPRRFLKCEYLEINLLGTIPLLIDSGTRIMLARIVGICADVPPRLRQYFDRLVVRAAFQRAKQAQAGGSVSAFVGS